MRVLVVDATPTTHQLVHKLLGEKGHELAASAQGAKEFLQRLAAGGADVALVDWALLSAGDFILLKTLRNNPKLARLPLLVMLGGDVDRARLAEAAKLGARNFIVKPFDAEGLDAKLRAAHAAAPAAPRPAGAEAAPQSAAPPGQGAPADEPQGRAAEVDVQARKLFMRGFEHLKRRKFQQAIAEFIQAIKIDDAFPEAYKGVAEALKGQGDWDKANQFLNKAAEAYVTTRRPAEAEGLYQRVRKQDPDAPNPFKAVADRLGGDKPEQAVELYEHAARLTPKDKDIARCLSKSYLQCGDKEKAAKTLEASMASRHGQEEFSEEELALFQEITGKDWYGHVAEQEELAVLDDAKQVDWNEKRNSPRIPLADYFVRVAGEEGLYPVVDISLTGIGFKAGEDAFERGQVIKFDLLALEQVKIKKLEAEVRHCGKVVCGCMFQNVQPKQKKQLDKIFVNEQKPGQFVVDKNVNFDIEMW